MYIYMYMYIHTYICSVLLKTITMTPYPHTLAVFRHLCTQMYINVYKHTNTYINKRI